MMQPTDAWHFDDRSMSWRLHTPRLGRVLVESEVRAGGVIVAEVAAPTPAAPAARETVPVPGRANRSVPEVIIPSGSANRANRSAEPPSVSVSAAEIQAAKAGGMVWVNTDSGVYHKGGQWYGATKQGKFMTERDAVKAGYRAAKNE